MKSLQIGNTHIVISHITHFKFAPAQGKPIVDESRPERQLREVPARLTIFVDGDHALEFDDEAANFEEAVGKLKSIFEL